MNRFLRNIFRGALLGCLITTTTAAGDSAERADDDAFAAIFEQELARAVESGLRPAAMLQQPRGRIGITLGRVNEALAAQLQIDPDEVILITSVIDGSPAEEAGVEPFDIITEVDGQSPVTQQRLREIIQSKEPGEQVNLMVLRGGALLKIDITIAKPDAERARLVEQARKRLEAEREAIEQTLANIDRFSENVREFTERYLAEQARERNGERRLRQFYGGGGGIGGGAGPTDRPHEAVRAPRGGSAGGIGGGRLRQPPRVALPDLPSIYAESVEIVRDNGVTSLVLRPRPDRLDPAATDELSRRMQAIEKRLERIEKMLEAALER